MRRRCGLPAASRSRRGSRPTQHNAETTMPTPDVQGIIGKWSAADQSGYGLFLDKGRLAVWLGGPNGTVEKVTASRAARPWVPSIPGTGRNPRPQGVSTTWYFVAATFDAASGVVTLRQEPVTEFTFDPTRAVVRTDDGVRGLASNTVPLLMAARMDRQQRGGCHRPLQRQDRQPAVVWAGARRADIDAIRRGGEPDEALSRRGTSRRMSRPARSSTPRSRQLDGTGRELSDQSRHRPQLDRQRDGLSPRAERVRRDLFPRRRSRGCAVGGRLRVQRARQRSSPASMPRGCRRRAAKTTCRSSSGRRKAPRPQRSPF